MSQATDKANITAAERGRRKQHRQDHYTDADRAFNGQGQKARRKGRQENWNAQDNKSASDFNFDQHGKGHVGGQEIKHLMNQGHSKEDIMSAAKESGGEIGKRAQKRFDRWGAAKEKAETVKDNPVNTGTDQATTPTDTTTPSTDTTTPSTSTQTIGSSNSGTGSNKSAPDVDGSATVNANQDNDINNNISGDDNYVYNRQDNSIRNYGGDTRVFNYQGGGDPSQDSPVSAATMGGFYDVDDSPGARAARLDQNVTMANDYAKDNMDVDWIASGAKHRAANDAYIDPGALDARIRARSTASFAKSEKRSSDLWGDVSQYGWGKPETPDPVEKPDYEEIGNTYTDF